MKPIDALDMQEHCPHLGVKWGEGVGLIAGARYYRCTHLAAPDGVEGNEPCTLLDWQGCRLRQVDCPDCGNGTVNLTYGRPGGDVYRCPVCDRDWLHDRVNPSTHPVRVWTRLLSGLSRKAERGKP